jgi:ABC-type Fe3+/spermidine/putrescine transport system ATPase subunit
VRPEDVRLAAREIDTAIAFRGVLEDLVYLGAFVRYTVSLPSGEHVTATSADRALRLSLAVGEPVWVGWSLDDQRVIEE